MEIPHIELQQQLWKFHGMPVHGKFHISSYVNEAILSINMAESQVFPTTFG
jgi:hypothetical protein